MIEHEFNTGRYYGPEGQRITWKIIYEDQDEVATISFRDHTRDINGQVRLQSIFLSSLTDTHVQIMELYDAGLYKWISQNAYERGLAAS